MFCCFSHHELQPLEMGSGEFGVEGGRDGGGDGGGEY